MAGGRRRGEQLAFQQGCKAPSIQNVCNLEALGPAVATQLLPLLHHASDAGRHATLRVLPPGVYHAFCGHCLVMLSRCRGHRAVLAEPLLLAAVWSEGECAADMHETRRMDEERT